MENLLKSNKECPLPEVTEMHYVELLSSELPARGSYLQ